MSCPSYIHSEADSDIFPGRFDLILQVRIRLFLEIINLNSLGLSNVDNNVVISIICTSSHK